MDLSYKDMPDLTPFAAATYKKDIVMMKVCFVRNSIRLKRILKDTMALMNTEHSHSVSKCD